jgi:hypothetical protein
MKRASKPQIDRLPERLSLKFKMFSRPDPILLGPTRFYRKWIKQHLRIKSFYGTSVNAVKSQIWIGLCIYLLVAIAKKRLGIQCSLYTLLQIPEVNIFEKEPIISLVSEAIKQPNETVGAGNQLNLFGN